MQPVPPSLCPLVSQVAPLFSRRAHELDSTSVSIEGDRIERLNEDGTVERLAVRPGAFTRWRQSSRRHALRTVGATRFANAIVALKGVPIRFGVGATDHG
jgi:hypothetical protein